MGRKWSSIVERESAWLPSYPTRLPSLSKWVAIAAASRWFQAIRISSYKRRIGCADEIVSVLDIQNHSLLSHSRSQRFSPALQQFYGREKRLSSPVCWNGQERRTGSNYGLLRT